MFVHVLYTAVFSYLPNKDITRNKSAIPQCLQCESRRLCELNRTSYGRYCPAPGYTPYRDIRNYPVVTVQKKMLHIISKQCYTAPVYTPYRDIWSYPDVSSTSKASHSIEQYYTAPGYTP